MKKSDMKPYSVTCVRGVVVLILIVVLAFSACFIRLADLTLFKGEDLREKAELQQLSDNPVDASRGRIYDSNMNILAESAFSWRVCINPSQVDESNRSDLISALSDILGVDAAQLSRDIDANQKYGYMVVKRNVDYPQKLQLSDRLKEHAISHLVSYESDSKRYYPKGTLASTILGFTGTDGNGLYGLEYLFDSKLTGTKGRVITAQDAVQYELENAYEINYEPQQGQSLVLTLNEEIQTILENALAGALKDTGARNVYGIVMDTATGAILAVANVPDYDPNHPFDVLYPELTNYFKENGSPADKENPVAAAREEQWKNKSVADYYYPGSVFKVFVVAGALEEGVIDENTTYNCVGTTTVGSRVIKDYNPVGHGVETPRTLLVNSCNTFAINVGLSMGAELYFKYYQAFGFSEKTGVDLAGESAPRATDPANKVYGQYHDPAISFTRDNLASASFGQSISVTPLQIVTAISAIGNGGKLMQPYIVGKTLDGHGNTVSVTEPVVKRQVVSETTAGKIASWMEDVVNDGTGKNAFVDGYHVAGKTGTSEKLGSSNKEYVASFAGFAPCNDPRISVVIVIDEPQGENYSGGVIAAPVAGEVIEKTLAYLGVEPSYSDTNTSLASAAMPDFTGKTVTEAKESLSDMKYTVRIVGEGDTVVAQSPEGGRKTPVNGVLVLYTETDYEKQTTTVPDFRGLTVTQANRLAVSNELNLRVSGSGSSESTVTAYKQDVAIGQEVEAGSVITVSFRTTTGVHD